jgi:hypothetical protein
VGVKDRLVSGWSASRMANALLVGVAAPVGLWATLLVSTAQVIDGIFPA